MQPVLKYTNFLSKNRCDFNFNDLIIMTNHDGKFRRFFVKEVYEITKRIYMNFIHYRLLII